jgi:peptidoglycan/xylan/chitin deacetylase (PgdA/CDA1 family)
VRLVTCLLALVVVAPQAPKREIALTFDDLPASQGLEDVAHLRAVNDRLLATLRELRAPAVGFVNEGKLGAGKERDERIAILRRWVAAGIPLGNHTFSHLDLNNTPLERYERDILDGDRVTPRLMREARMTARWFRHPYTHTGSSPEIKAALVRFLDEQGYRVAPFTVEIADYVFSDVYRRARVRKDEDLARRITKAYLAHIDTMLDFYEPLSRSTFGREIRQVLLIHVNDLNADFLLLVMEKLKLRGYAFITLARALEDEAYATPDAYVGRAGPSWLHRWRVASRLPSRLSDEPDPPDWILKLYRP